MPSYIIPEPTMPFKAFNEVKALNDSPVMRFISCKTGATLMGARVSEMCADIEMQTALQQLTNNTVQALVIRRANDRWPRGVSDPGLELSYSRGRFTLLPLSPPPRRISSGITPCTPLPPAPPLHLPLHYPLHLH